jgi:hypothetical protein
MDRASATPGWILGIFGGIFGHSFRCTGIEMGMFGNLGRADAGPVCFLGQ